MMFFKLLLLSSVLFSQSIHQLQMQENRSRVLSGLDVFVSEHLDLVKGKRVGLVTNHTGIDQSGNNNYEIFMQLDDVDLKAILTPEHGFHGDVADGQIVQNRTEENLPKILSLYGKTRKPTPEMLQGLDVIIYDIQDVGTRFYTYISTLGLVIEAASEADIPVIVLDRPNPLGGIVVDGPIMSKKYMSFVGMYPIPIQYGLTPGELAKMIIGEKWIIYEQKLEVVQMKGWKRSMQFVDTGMIWVHPSPNIPNLETALRYPGLCLIEGTNVSEGRGTENPFTFIGAPWIDSMALIKSLNNKHLNGVNFKPVSFTPVTIPGKALNPKYENELCYGVNIVIEDRIKYDPIKTGVEVIRTLQQLYPDHLEWNDYIYKLWGNDDLLEYDRSVNSFKERSKKYYLYD